MEVKSSPDERITMNALENVDPFARKGQVQRPISQPKVPSTKRDFSHYDEPIESSKPPVEKFTPPEDVKEKKKPGRKHTPKIELPVAKEEQKLHKEEALPNPIVESRTAEGMPSYRCEFAGRDIMVGFPCYKTTNPVTAFAMIAMALDFGRDKIRFDMSIGDAMVYHSRNMIAHKFLETDAKWLLMIDDDIIPCIGRPEWMRAWVPNTRKVLDQPLQRHVLHRLIGSGKTLIGGAYFGRQEGAPLMCSDRSLESKARVYQDEVATVDWVATGCMLVHRKVFDSIRETHPDLKNDVEKTFNYFQPIDGANGEDVSFCKRAKKAGHQPHIDLGLPVFHVGYKLY